MRVVHQGAEQFLQELGLGLVEVPRAAAALRLEGSLGNGYFRYLKMVNNKGNNIFFINKGSL